MRKVDRSIVNVPLSLQGPSKDVGDEKVAAKIFYAAYVKTAKSKGYEFKCYKPEDVKSSLRILFKNKCAYCESDFGDDMDVEHFRPKGGITGAPKHFGYWWLAHSWNNLLPSCTPCNRKRAQHVVTEDTTEAELAVMQAARSRSYSGKANHFPISGVRATCETDDLDAEIPVLLDPTRDDPEVYLQWSLSATYSVVLPKPVSDVDRHRALVTISIFALNRLHLVQSRTRILRVLRFQAEKILEDLERDFAQGGSAEAIGRALKRAEELRIFHAAEQPYSAMAKAFVDSFLLEMQART